METVKLKKDMIAKLKDSLVEISAERAYEKANDI